VSIVYERTGAGKPLFLIHGLGSSRRVWDAPLGLLNREREVIAIDLPGFGDSPMLTTAPTPAALADAVEQLFAELGIDRPAVAGNSLGGWISLELARRGSVSSAVALSPAGFWNGPEMRMATVSLKVSRAAATAAEPLLGALASNPIGRKLLTSQLVGRPEAVPADEMVTAVSGLIHAQGFEATRLALFGSVWEHRGPLESPAVVAWGEKDRLLLPRQAKRAAEWIPGIKSITLAGCGHVPCWDDPPLVARTILDGTLG
jgi:pimeloyl-ACP methyl ester carboxylesterase